MVSNKHNFQYAAIYLIEYEMQMKKRIIKIVLFLLNELFIETVSVCLFSFGGGGAAYALCIHENVSIGFLEMNVVSVYKRIIQIKVDTNLLLMLCY